MFIVDIKPGRRRLLVSYRQLDEALKKRLAKNKTRQMFVIYVTTKGDAPSGKVVK